MENIKLKARKATHHKAGPRPPERLIRPWLAERNARGISSKVMIPSNKSKVPQNLSGDNKRRLIYLMRETIIPNMAKALDFLCCQEIYFSTYKDCRKITPISCKIEAELISNQEEADTKIVLHCCHALSVIPQKRSWYDHLQAIPISLSSC